MVETISSHPPASWFSQEEDYDITYHLYKKEALVHFVQEYPRTNEWIEWKTNERQTEKNVNSLLSREKEEQETKSRRDRLLINSTRLFINVSWNAFKAEKQTSLVMLLRLKQRFAESLDSSFVFPGFVFRETKLGHEIE